MGRDHGHGEPSNALWDMASGLTSDIRQRQLHDEAMKCGSQPANIRMIKRRLMITPLSMIWNILLKKLPLRLKLKRKADYLFSIDKCQSYQSVCHINVAIQAVF